MSSFFTSASVWVLIPLFGMLIPIIGIISSLIHWWHGESERHQTIRELARHGQPIPPELLQSSRRWGHESGHDSQTDPGPPSRLNPALRTGIILVGVGVGIAATLYVLIPDTWLWGAGFIPAGLGVAFLVIAMLEKRAAP